MPSTDNLHLDSMFDLKIFLPGETVIYDHNFSPPLPPYENFLPDGTYVKNVTILNLNNQNDYTIHTQNSAW